MINTVESLRGLYVALGGNITEVANLNTIPELLTEISTVAQAAATELPAVKPADNGKVLTVVNSKWAKADLPTAASDKLGCVKVGSGLSIADGVLSASGGLPAATAADKNKYLVVNNNGEWVKSSYASMQRAFSISGTTAQGNVSVSLPSNVNWTQLSNECKNGYSQLIANCVVPNTQYTTDTVILYPISWYTLTGAKDVIVFHGYYEYTEYTPTTGTVWKEIFAIVRRGSGDSDCTGEVYINDATLTPST